MLRAILVVGFLAVSAFAAADEAPIRFWVNLDPEATERMYETLRDQTVSRIDFAAGTPLREAVDYLGGLIGHEIQIDEYALDELGLSPDEPIEIKAQGLKLGAVLKLLLEPLECECTVRDGALVVTTFEDALYRLTTAVYPVSDLLHQHDYDSLTDSITATIAADTWAENGGGEAEVRAFPRSGVLIISQACSVHQEIAGLLRALRVADSKHRKRNPRQPLRVEDDPFADF